MINSAQELNSCEDFFWIGSRLWLWLLGEVVAEAHQVDVDGVEAGRDGSSLPDAVEDVHLERNKLVLKTSLNRLKQVRTG